MLGPFELVVNTVSMEEVVQQQLEVDGKCEAGSDCSDKPARENASTDSEYDNQTAVLGDAVASKSN